MSAKVSRDSLKDDCILEPGAITLAIDFCPMCGFLFVIYLFTMCVCVSLSVLQRPTLVRETEEEAPAHIFVLLITTAPLHVLAPTS